MSGRPTALLLFSGGLDSQLAAHLVREQGVGITGVHFLSVFWEGTETRVRAAAEEVGLELTEPEISEDMIELVKAPPHGYGKRMNPCLDCKILTLSRARRLMQERGYRFIVTGEVLGQRPMSQRRDCFPFLEKAADLRGLIVRPLCGKLLPATIPEEEGWISREQLLAISGRSRKVQLAMAAELGLSRYGSPGGGCSLTEPGFSGRLRDLLQSEGTWDVGDIRLLRIGRHFRITSKLKLVVGRNEQENRRLETYLDRGDLKLDPHGVPGPLALLRGDAGPEDLAIAMGIVARYSDRVGNTVEILVMKSDGGEVARGSVPPLPDDEIRQLRI